MKKSVSLITSTFITTVDLLVVYISYISRRFDGLDKVISKYFECRYLLVQHLSKQGFRLHHVRLMSA